jgi:hypothetical protein
MLINHLLYIIFLFITLLKRLRGVEVYILVKVVSETKVKSSLKDFRNFTSTLLAIYF